MIEVRVKTPAFTDKYLLSVGEMYHCIGPNKFGKDIWLQTPAPKSVIEHIMNRRGVYKEAKFSLSINLQMLFKKLKFRQ
jgi:hypothetical protein